MKSINRRQFGVVCAGVAASAAGESALAQAARPELAKILVGFPPGGTTDVVARLLAEQLRGDIAESVIVETKTGAAGRIALQAMRQSPPDGLTMLVHAGAIQSLFPHIVKQLGYEPWTDVASVSTVCRIETCFIVGPAVPVSVRTLQDYFDWARQDKRNATFASPGPGTPQHLFGVVMGQTAKIDLAPVHYRGSTSAMPDILGGQVPAGSTPLNDAMIQMASGKIRILATGGDKRNPLTPDVPTFAELGFPQLVNVDHFEIFVHGKTPAAIQERLSVSIRKALTAPALVSGFRRLFVEPVGSTPQEALRTHRLDYEINARMVKAVGYEPE